MTRSNTYEREGLPTADLVKDSQQRCRNLLDELESFRQLLKERGNDPSGISKFIREIGIEAKFLESIHRQLQSETSESVDVEVVDEEVTGPRHKLLSSNLTFYEAVWACAKKSSNVTGIRRKVDWQVIKSARSDQWLACSNGPTPARMAALKQKKVVSVDVIAENGLQWIKVWNRSESRLLMEMAKEGWAQYGESPEDEDEVGEAKHDLSSLPLVKIVDQLVAAARRVRVNYRHPSVYVDLPNVRRGVYSNVDAVMERLQSGGAVVRCRSDDKALEQAEAVDEVRSGLEKLLPSLSTTPLTTTLNIDCTILVALVSDISHVSRDDIVVPKHYSGQSRADITRQIDSEITDPLLPNELYPVLTNTDLTCTAEAAAHVRSIVHKMGSKGECCRADIIFGECSRSAISSPDLIKLWSSHSQHETPSGLRLPIKIVEAGGFHTAGPAEEKSLKADIVEEVTKLLRLTPLNRSVLLSGWAYNLVTITRNRILTERVERSINEFLNDHEGSHPELCLMISGPQVRVYDRERSLVGSEKPNQCLRPVREP